ncbi:OLC1v1021277C1 [Oldenlandia corymbosa var. corymbosa]|uniref:O-fucosyltransferase family protein n=1 Tax=Oldenlandia corymbosa var. corymbosa TaxID=529605 RepID=A0AAV1BVA7_OLDCO|nr:OLC1v1021277C1 [Oldenlandia corymbosa var. corymbosa]
MGKQTSPRSPRPKKSILNISYGVRDYHQSLCSEMQQNGDPYKGRRGSGGDSKWFRTDSGKFASGKGFHGGKKHIWWLRSHIRLILLTFLFMGSLLLLDSVFFSLVDAIIFKNYYSTPRGSTTEEDAVTGYRYEERKPIKMYDHLLHLASRSIAEKEFEEGASKFWEELYPQASLWKPCADKKSPKGKTSTSSGLIIVSANGGLNQQRVAVCNAVAVASLLNATLVIPKFLYSNVWNDPSQFGDIYQEDYFIDILKNDIEIVKEIPDQFRSLDFDAIGSQVTDADLSKEATPQEYILKILPILLRNGVVHFLGFGNRLGFDPLPIELQRLRCKCNFHALKYVPKIQQAGSLLIRRLRKYDASRSTLDKQLLGSYIQDAPSKESHPSVSPLKYLALHLRFEIDMVAYSICEFGGGENERRELQEYREAHFPLLVKRIKNSDPSPGELRKLGRCPLTPEEAALVLAALGFKNNTYIYLASSEIYGGESRMHPFISLYPNVVTKEDLLSPSELAPFRNFSSQLAALDFIACATADVFSITDSGSQLSSLVSGFRTYYGGGSAPTLSPLKKRLAAILSKNSTIKWSTFEKKVQKMIEESQRVRQRGFHRSLYRHPRCKGCMCKYH